MTVLTSCDPVTLRMAILSDIHLGHRQNPTRDIVINLMAALPDNEETAQLDFIILAGDVFDDLLLFNVEDVVEIELWIANLLRLCKKHTIKLRILEGTPSHDWKQSNQFVSINEFTGIGADLKYVRELALEYEEDHDLWFLFVPDEWDSPDQTLSQAERLMETRGITQVDYAVMHGQFKYQLPEVVRAPKHDEWAWLTMVKHLIFIGHVHTFTNYRERIWAQGSFDRLTHGQEEPKGHLRVTVADGRHHVEFRETPQAKIFRTIECQSFTVEEALFEIGSHLPEVPLGSFLRIQVEQGHPLIGNLDTLRKQYPEYNWTKEKVLVNGIPLIEKDDVIEMDYTPITITPENIERQVNERLLLMDLHTDINEQARLILTEVK